MKKLTYLFILAILFVSMIFLVDATKAQEENTDSTDPVPCTMDYTPVCGEDGETYSNRCVAENQYNVEVMEEGECDNSSVIDDDGDGIGDTEEEDTENGDDVDDNNDDEEDVDDNDDQEDVDDDEGEEEEEMEESDDDDIVRMRKSAGLLIKNQIMNVLREIKETRNQIRERNVELNQLKRLENEMMKVSEAIQESINTFVAYGVDDNTKRLGEGERAAVIYSYKEAYEKLPETEEELTDVIKISNGRWPSKTSRKAENEARKTFREIYKRELRDSNPHDMSAMKIMAYGLKQRAENRNLDSERRGIEIFEDIFEHVPESTEDWNAMQAITYSGATR